MIERVSPALPRLEMFARRHASGWDVWGNEVTTIAPLEVTCDPLDTDNDL